jgi:hypothetical protein
VVSCNTVDGTIVHREQFVQDRSFVSERSPMLLKGLKVVFRLLEDTNAIPARGIALAVNPRREVQYLHRANLLSLCLLVNRTFIALALALDMPFSPANAILGLPRCLFNLSFWRNLVAAEAVAFGSLTALRIMQWIFIVLRVVWTVIEIATKVWIDLSLKRAVAMANRNAQVLVNDEQADIVALANLELL